MRDTKEYLMNHQEHKVRRDFQPFYMASIEFVRVYREREKGVS